MVSCQEKKLAAAALRANVMSQPSSSIAVQLQKLEEDLLQPGIRRSPESVAAMLTDNFCEFGSSGRIFRKEEVIEALRTEAPGQISIADFSVRNLTPETALVTYCAIRRGETNQEARTSLRSSMWVLRDGRWQMLFHQGTNITEP